MENYHLCANAGSKGEIKVFEHLYHADLSMFIFPDYNQADACVIQLHRKYD